MEYLFVLGRNVELSKTEVYTLLSKWGIEILNSSINENGFLIKTKDALPEKIISEFGGVIAIGEVLWKGKKEIEKGLKNIMIYRGSSNKLNYAIYDFSDEEFFDLIQDYIKARFKEEKLKASYKNLTGNLKLQEGKKSGISASRTDEDYFTFSDDKQNYFGRIIESCSYEEIQKRDMEKPVRREELAISPRLAKIMINLSNVNSGQTIIDPFCGIGAILQEALVKGIKVIGIDKDKDAIEGAKQNLAWGNFPKDSYKLILNDSRKASVSNSNAVVFEPYMGRILKKIPNEEEARRTLNEVENLVVEVLNNLKPKVSGRFVFTMPYIRTMKKRLGIDKENLISRTELKLVEFTEIENPIPEFRDNQIVGREIFILGK